MKVLREGHKYELESFEPLSLSLNSMGNQVENHQTLQFIEKVPGDEPGSLVTINNGTTNEEVLAMLIDRINYLQQKFPCRENAIAITHIETALMWLNERTRKRKAQNVEGKQLVHK